MNQTVSKTYCGVGSRETPPNVQHVMCHIAGLLEKMGYTPRSGVAEGADDAFEKGVKKPAKKEIFLPWPRFNGRCPSCIVKTMPEAMQIAADFHPAWDRLSPTVRTIMARNTHQILGRQLNDPVKFGLCWTPNGSGKGGTGQAIRIAKALTIPVFDMGGMTLQELEDRMNELLA